MVAPMRRLGSVLTLFAYLSVAGCSTMQDELKAHRSKGQQLVIAAFELDVDRVATLLAEGIDPDTRLGFYDEHLFEDKWTLGYSKVGSEQWTPMLAVANSHREPQPITRTENTVTDLDSALQKLRSVDPKLIAEREFRRIKIAKLLINANANIDLDDGFGTALSTSVYNGYDDLSLLLISSNADIDTKTGTYIDGEGYITPVHRATKSPKVLRAMIKRGAKVNVADTTGSTPLHWAVRNRNLESVKLLLQAGADLTAIDNEGRSPSHWCKLQDGVDCHEDMIETEISELLDDVGERIDNASKK